MKSPSSLPAAALARSNGGFTLIELMIAVAVLSILAAIAIPAYSSYITRSHIPNATNGLSAAAAQMEQYFQDYRSYTAPTGAAPNPPCLTSQAVGGTAANPDFYISCVAGANPPAAMTAAGYTPGITASTYTIVAYGNGQMAGFTYIISQGANGISQWSQAGSVWSSKICGSTWIMKSGVC
jgi:type IV pilus assembly protein PilE